MIDDWYWMRKGLFVLALVVIALGVVFVIALWPDRVGAVTLLVIDEIKYWFMVALSWL